MRYRFHQTKFNCYDLLIPLDTKKIELPCSRVFVILIIVAALLLSMSNTFSQSLKVTGKVFLEGPFDDGASRMIARLKLDSLVSKGLIPEAPTTLPVPKSSSHGYNAVDAVKLLLIGTDFKEIDSIYAWLAEDGTLYENNTGTIKTMTFLKAPEGTYYLAVRHRNHLAIMSTSTMSFRYNSIINYDFTKMANIYQDGAILVTPTICAMIGGNAISDRRGEVNARDLYAVSKDSDNLREGYLTTDVDLNAVVNALDRQLTLEHNLKLYHSKVPQ